MSGVFYNAAAGSGKTTHLARLAAAHTDGRVLFTAFTDENTDEIGRVFLREYGHIPRNIEIVPRCTFLLREGVKPYQGSVGLAGEEVCGIKLVNGASALRSRKHDLRCYVLRQFDGSFRIYSDKVAEFALYIDKKIEGLVFDRMSRLYSMVYIDEV